MCFKPNSLNSLFVPTLCLNDAPLIFVTSNKYLGVLIHEKHQDDDIMLNYFIQEGICLSVTSKHVPPVLK